MQKFIILSLFLSTYMFSQENITTKPVDTIDIQTNTSWVNLDDFGTTYYIKENIFYKLTEHNHFNYSNYQLGKPSTVNIFNPLKINLFYEDFNTLIVLDNRLAEIFKVDFNTIQPYKNVSCVSTGNDNSVWLFNINTQTLELYDYKKNTIKAKSLPIEEQPISITSDFNFCWLLTTKHIYKYNYFGSLIYKIENNGFETISQFNEKLYLAKQNKVYLYDEDHSNYRKIDTPNLLIKQFFVNHETLYIYTGKTLNKLHLKL
ncbi:hypothetical protein [Mangrovimonas spongiae]|uniref:Uncharacterized protein n=1 Tax=Mangrovimonas spongiae TaxID=2494697 RepID=A0A3R9NR88_9FLAO|nr:hypothetical protein [Mangrovimonas spongiae]RSK39885.1 hypothetical protein EJA19_08360 [Mangrovimonas spongiae]